MPVKSALCAGSIHLKTSSYVSFVVFHINILLSLNLIEAREYYGEYIERNILIMKRYLMLGKHIL